MANEVLSIENTVYDNIRTVIYKAFPIRDALRLELSWTHYRLLMKIDMEEKNGKNRRI